MTASRPLLALAAGLLLSSGCSDDDDGAVGASLSIEPCSDAPTLDCGVMHAPLIPESTDTRRIAIDVVRYNGTGDGPHELLIVNPGGPGASATDLVREFARRESLPAALRERFDIVGMDPRGIGNSERIDCSAYGLDGLDDYPVDDAALVARYDAARSVAEACHAEYGERLQRLGSNAVVADMEALRGLLDAPRLNGIGYSYGTRLAALYLARHPQTSGRFVLDGSLLPNGALEPLVQGMASAQQRNLEALLDACGTAVADCDRAGLPGALRARLDSIAATQDELAYELFAELLSVAVERPDLGELLAPVLIDYILDGDLGPLIELAQAQAAEDDGPLLPTGDNATVGVAVLCADDGARPTLDALRELALDLNMRSDVFAEADLALASSCAGWPDAVDPVAPIATDEAPASLVVVGTRDAQTPAQWGLPMAAAIGGRLLVSAHAGHTAVFNGRSACVDAAALGYLLDGTLPPEGSRCPADADEESLQ